MKKVTILLLSLCLAFCGFGLAACDKEPEVVKYEVYFIMNYPLSDGTFHTGEYANFRQRIEEGSLVIKPEDPTHLPSIYKFGGWFQEAQCNTPWGFYTDRVYSDVYLYAKWEPV